MKRCVVIFCLCIAATQVFQAQQSVTGSVTDAQTGEPVDAATIQLLHGRNEKLVNYTLTTARGCFTMQVRQTDSLQLVVSLLGYKTVKQAVRTGEDIQIFLETQAFALREVEIRPGRV